MQVRGGNQGVAGHGFKGKKAFYSVIYETYFRLIVCARLQFNTSSRPPRGATDADWRYPPVRRLFEKLGVLAVERCDLEDRDPFHFLEDQKIIVTRHDADGIGRHSAAEEHIILGVPTEL